MGIIKALKLGFDYQRYDDDGNVVDMQRAVNDVNLDIEAGEFVAVLGHNGSGKSTLAKHMNALLIPTEGTMLVDGIDTARETKLWKVRQKAGMVFQNPDNQIIGTVVEEDVGFGPENMGIPTDDIWKRVNDSLEKVGMTAYRYQSPNKLSGGQKQRVAIAGVMAMRPRCIILDEPTVGLDPKQINEIRDLIKGLKQKHTVILSSHILSEVSAVCDYVLIISHGKLVASDTPENLGKLAAGSNNLNLLVKGQKDTIRAALEAVEGVKEVTVKKSPEEGVYAITVGTEENMDVREKVFYSMVNAGCPILEMQSRKVSLEEIFLELTESEKKDKDASGKKSGKSFFKTAADAEKYLNEKNEDAIPDNGLEEKRFDESDKISDEVSDNGLSGDTQDIFAESEKEKGEE